MRLYGLRRTILRASLRRAWTAPHARSAPSFVYVMQSDGPALKIGSSADPERRRRQLQTGSAADIRILHTVPVYGDPVAVERAAQDMLSSHRLRLEWYDVPPDLAVGAIYAAAFRLGAMSPSIDAERPYAFWRWTSLSAAASLPFWWLAAHGRPLGAVTFMTVAMAAGTSWWLLSRRRMPLPWIAAGVIASAVAIAAWPARAAEAVPTIDGAKYCASVAGFVGDNEVIRKGCLDNETRYQRHVQAVWSETPQSVRDQCRKTLALVTPSYQGLAGCMSLAVGTMWMNGEVTIQSR